MYQPQLNALSANVLPGDKLDIEVAFNNRGITTNVTDARHTRRRRHHGGVAGLQTYQAYKMSNLTVPNGTTWFLKSNGKIPDA